VQPLVPKVRALIADSVSRGRVNCSITFTALQEKAAGQVVLDEPLAASYLRALRKAGKTLDLAPSGSEELLLSLPNVVKVQDPSLSEAALWKALRPVVQEALAAMVDMRQTEGRRLLSTLQGQLKTLQRLRKKILDRAPRVVEAHRQALQERLEAQGLDQIDWGNERMARELLLFADRSDISEELQRLQSHLAEASNYLADENPVGRTLDFLCQELFREINTTGSKASDTTIALTVVEFKTTLEQFREQVQNIE